jgi:intein-encoded DNA endonuclease-like protein
MSVHTLAETQLFRNVLTLHSQGLSTRKIAKRTGVPKSTVHNWVSERNNPLSKLNIFDLESSPELSYVLGVYYGDGSAGKYGRQYRIELAVKDRDFAEAFNYCISKIVGKDSLYKTTVDKYGKFWVRAFSKTLYQFLKQPLRRHKVVIEKFPAMFLRGFFDSEGSFYAKVGKKSYANLHVANSNLSLLRYARELLRKHFSISSQIYLSNVKGSAHKINDYTFKTKKNCYSLTITNMDSIQKFYTKIGFTIKRKKDKIEKYLKSKVGREDANLQMREVR